MSAWNKTGNMASLKPVAKKSHSLEEIKSDMITQIPGFGRKSANHMAHKYKLVDLISMSEKKLSKVKVDHRTIGKRAKKFLEVFHK